MHGINKPIAHRIIQEIFIDGHLHHLEELVAADIIVHHNGKQLHGLQLFRQHIITLRTAFANLYYTIEDLLADEDKIILRCRVTGTHLGAFMNIEATGKKITYPVILIWRFSGARLSEQWSVSDEYGMLQQLEAVQLK
jgi:predicted ester cyclase